MRWVISVLTFLALPASAFAADLDGDFNVLRGAEPAYHWGGFYGGLQVGDTSGKVNFGQAASPEIAFMLRDTAIEQDQQISKWTVLGSRTPNATNLGGFVGYNVEWESVITGFEVDYSHGSLFASSGDSIARSFTDSTNLPAGHHYDYYDVNVDAQSSLHITDVATFRARGGWEAGNFLPYGFIGFALGRADVSTSATLSYTASDVPDVQTPPTPQLVPLPPLAFNQTDAQAQGGAFIYGFATGVGMDVALTSNVFVRGEFEYIYFAPIAGIQASIASAHVGAGVKF